MKLNDLVRDLKRTLDIKEFFPIADVKVVEETSKKSTSDIRPDLQDIVFETDTQVRLHRNNTKNFDALKKNSVLGKMWRDKPLDITKTKSKYSLKSLHDAYINIDFKELVFENKLFPVFVAGFLLFLWCFLYLDKIMVENRVNAWYTKILSLKDAGYSIKDIKKTVNSSRLDFMLANLWFTPFRVIWNQQIKNANAIIKGWKYLTETLDDTLFVYKKTENFINKKWFSEINFVQLLINLKPELKVIEWDIEGAVSYYNKVQDLWDPNLEASLTTWVWLLTQAQYYISTINDNFDTLLSILWYKKQKRYLVVFQNTDEIRPMWGFMWSMWIMTLANGNIKSFEKKDVYAYEWNLKRALYDRLKAPEWLDKITDSFWLRDANYFLNTRDSSRSIKFFIEKAGYKIDGVIYVNQNTLLDFLDETWEVDFEKLWLKVNSANFSELFSTLVEAKLFKVWTLGTPKSILFDFIWEFTSKLLEDWDYFAYSKILLENVQKREIMFYAFNPEENQFLQKLWLTGDIDFEETFDVAYPSFTSISWNKSDRYIRREYIKNVNIDSNTCEVQTDFTIRLRHTFSAWDRSRIENLFETYEISGDNLMSIQWAGDNYQYVRVILPKNAVITPQQDIINIVEHKRWKTVEFYIKTPAWGESIYTIWYQIPNPDCKSYDFKLVKQPGVKKYDMTMSVGKDFEKEVFITHDYYYKTSP